MDRVSQLIDFTNRAMKLEEVLNSDAMLSMTDEEFLLLEGMHKGLEAYCCILKKRIKEEEASVIKLKDLRGLEDEQVY